MTIKSILISIFLADALTAQVTPGYSVVLKNWPAPLYWQPAPAKTEPSGEGARVSSAAPHSDPTVSPLVFVAMTPCRVVDTRASQMFAVPFGQPSLTAGPARSFPITLSPVCSIPSIAQAYSLNVTAIPPGGLGFLTLWPTGQAQPNAVTLDDITGDIRNNAAIVPAGTPNGSISAVVNGNTELVIDINGYYEPLNNAPQANGNTAFGIGALFLNTSGVANTASGSLSLFNNTTGSHNTASGHDALFSNSTGAYNTATGENALYSNTTASYNTASGAFSLDNNTSGSANTASGYGSLFSNTTGTKNTATGVNALYYTTTGSLNTASGHGALLSNTEGIKNTASGQYALANNTTGASNTASGSGALYGNTTGSLNTAIGIDALEVNQIGIGNISIGALAGDQITGSDNIDIGSEGAGTDNGIIRIGTPGTHKAFVAAGVWHTQTNPGPVPVLIDQYGLMGTQSSSRRYKEDIEDMSDASSALLSLRPVKFRYRKPYSDGSKPLDYGLIAEEVAEIYPDLVVKGSDGQIETVQYQKLTPMLLNELKKEHNELQRERRERSQQQENQAETIQSLQAQVAALQKALEALLAGKTP